MGKKRKLVPVELWQRGQVESWLTEQAQHGLKLEKINSFMATFQKTEPQDLEYRMIIMHEKDSFPPNTKALEQEGWQYVVSYEYYHIFCSQQADASSEIESLVEQAASFDEIIKKTRNQILINSVSTIVILTLIIALFRNAMMPITNTIEGYTLGTLFMIFTNSCMVVIFLTEWLGVKRLKRQLQQGRALDYRAGWRIPRLKKFGWKLGYLSIIIVCFVVIIKQVNSSSYETLPNDTGDLPILRLAMIESPEILTQQALSENDWYNLLEQNRSIFAPEQYKFRETLSVRLENQQLYEPRFEYNTIECVVPSLAIALFNEWATYYEVDNEPNFSHTEFDHVLVAKIYEDTSRILTIKEKRVQYVDYQGEANIETILKALENL
ncbi:DUF2812 domain-containing protein [Solibacillus daqui]|uniref:DUF2812 domain-containing protein n=1 Tax=Solibacillus daqui TaxID=2912187 RepID=UPI0023659B83|nr:DUF2812 domain-containing protein [Solibacillus daqui]